MQLIIIHARHELFLDVQVDAPPNTMALWCSKCKVTLSFNAQIICQMHSARHLQPSFPQSCRHEAPQSQSQLLGGARWILIAGFTLQSFKMKETDINFPRQDMGTTPRAEKPRERKVLKCEECGTLLGHSQQCPNPRCRGPRRNPNYSFRYPQVPIPVQLLRGERDADSPSLNKDAPPGLSSRGLGDSSVQNWKDSSYLDEVWSLLILNHPIQTALAFSISYAQPLQSLLHKALPSFRADILD